MFLKKHSEPTKSVCIIFFGGEPLLNIDVLKETTIYAKKILKDRVEFGITTNALNLTDDIISFLKEYNIVPLFSLDGGEKETNLLRKSYDSGVNVFKTAIANLKKYIKITGIRPNVRATLTKINNNKEKIARSLYNEGFYNVTISTCSPYKNNNDGISLTHQDIKKYKKHHENYVRYINNKLA